MVRMDARKQLTIARIVKVNHAGEYGAIRIYRAQLWLAHRLYPDIVAFLEETLGHEIEHCVMFRDAMPQRSARPCRVMSLWAHGGFLLGFVTALMGRKGVWVCTAAVEATVHRHLEEQLNFLRGPDPELHGLISAIREQELMHLAHAEERIGTTSAAFRLLTDVIANVTDAV